MPQSYDSLKLDGVVTEFVAALPAIAKEAPWRVSSNIGYLLGSDTQEEYLAELGAKIDNGQRRAIIIAATEQIPHILPHDQSFVRFLLDACHVPRHLGHDAKLETDVIKMSIVFIAQIPEMLLNRQSLTNDPYRFVADLYHAAKGNAGLQQNIDRAFEMLGSDHSFETIIACRPRPAAYGERVDLLVR